MYPYQYPNVQIIILAAGKGTRMKSTTPKVLHSVLGRTMLEHVLHMAEALRPLSMAVVVGHASEKIRASVGDPKNLCWVEQEKQLGTGHAVLQCEEEAEGAEHVVIICADTPLLKAATLANLIDAHVQSGTDISLLSAQLQDAKGYGRICRNAQGEIEAVVEHRDASAKQLAIQEINSGIFCVKKDALFSLLKQVTCDNSQQEYYLPDIIPLALKKNLKVNAIRVEDVNEIVGVNDRVQLAMVENIMQQQIIRDWQYQGVTIEQPETVRIEALVKLGGDTCVRAGCQLLGATSIGDACTLGPFAVIEDSWIDDDVKIEAFSHLQGAYIGSASDIGPFARLRPDAKLDEKVRIGNFVEVKKAVIGEGSKINHLSYIGDTEMGKGCNVGAGSITCNYDGANKHKTIIGDQVFVGSDTKLIAPVEVKSGATIGAGSIITKTVPENGLTLSARPEQRHVREWQRPKKSDN